MPNIIQPNMIQPNMIQRNGYENGSLRLGREEGERDDKKSIGRNPGKAEKGKENS